jgi:rhodanese-related sulfurtransferase
MITIHPFGLATLIDNREPLDLIDIRTEKEFKSSHIAGAQSVPLKKISASKVLRDRKSATTEPLYVIGDSRVRASLAAGILTGGGCCQAVVLDGGMDAWISQGLSVVREKKRFWNHLTLLTMHIDADEWRGVAHRAQSRGSVRFHKDVTITNLRRGPTFD